jgi:hypothetical protein
VKLPAILFESDPTPPATPATSPEAARFDLGTAAPATPQSSAAPWELPESYDTRRLVLVAADPFWLYAHWDLNEATLHNTRAAAADGALHLRVFREGAAEPVADVALQSGTREWFVNVPLADATYTAALGYFSHGNLHTLAQSQAVRTPAAAISRDTSVAFNTVPIEAVVDQVISAVAPAAVEASPRGFSELHFQIPPTETPRAHAISEQPNPSPPIAWTPAQERAFAEVVRMVESARGFGGASDEFVAFIQRQIAGEVPPAPSVPEMPSSISVAAVPPAQKKGFWFNVNAELVIYGATEADARVTIGGRPIRLRPDGSFSFRFALPDGRFELPVVAVKADHTDARAAELSFSRATEYRGEVAAHPQDPALKPPLVENVA